VNGVSVRKRRDAVTEGTSRASRRPAIQAARSPQSRWASQAARATVRALSTIPTQTTTRGSSPATAYTSAISKGKAGVRRVSAGRSGPAAKRASCRSVRPSASYP